MALLLRTRLQLAVARSRISRALVAAPKPSQRSNYSSTSSTKSSSSLGLGLTLLGVTTVGALGFFYLNNPRASLYKIVAMPTIHAVLDGESAHRLAILMAKNGISPHDRVPDDPVLSVKVWGKTFSNPVGLAAGCDKHAEAIDAMLAVGFGFVEVGSVTPKPQLGNPRPRMFRLHADNAVINRYGFNSEGHDAVSARLRERLRRYIYTHQIPAAAVEAAQKDSYGASVALPENVPRALVENKLLGINLGKNKLSPADDDDDYVEGVRKLGPMADYVVVNISSPNTPGLRALQRREPLERLLKNVKAARDAELPHRPPLLVKIAPDVDDEQLQDVAAVIQSVGFDGIVISNTTISRPKTLKSEYKITKEVGGLSGAPVFPLALETVRKFYSLTKGAVPIVGCGGVRSADEAISFARAGATLVQLYTSFGMEGPGVVADTKDELTRRLKAMGVRWTDLVGSDHKTGI
ncbi:Dihydroorotate dehydrogenase-domain-containing protein [Cladochytrium replicatum]|nr:Dihydroorotate dehydrogenase-domain-containing protein [Cladochytrium replicatum]